MKNGLLHRAGLALLLGAWLLVPATAAAEPLPSWRDGPVRQAITDFVAAVSTPGGVDFVPADERIAVFDNDGTLWSEKPVYFQLLFAMDRVRETASKHPQWKEQQPFRAVLENDLDALVAAGKHGLLELVMSTHAGMSTDEFAAVVDDWIRRARHPQTDRLYTEMVFQPMLELLAYLRDHDFRTYIVSGGGIAFMRPWVGRVYGVPPEQVVGSSIKTVFEMTDSGPQLRRLPEIDFIDDKAGKPVGIHRFIGRRPIFAAGNSDGDLQMLQWTTADERPNFSLLVHHTDAEREWAYDRESAVGRLDEALEQAPARGWTVVDMRRDWEVIHPQSITAP